MNRKELVDALATKTGSTKINTDRNIAALIDVITDTLKNGDSISMVGFGSLEVRSRSARTGRTQRLVKSSRLTLLMFSFQTRCDAEGCGKQRQINQTMTGY